MDPRAGLDEVEKRKFLHHWDSNSDPLVVQPVASRYTDYAIPTPFKSPDTACVCPGFVNQITLFILFSLWHVFSLVSLKAVSWIAAMFKPLISNVGLHLI
jgi:hypothetical protein